MYKRTLFLAISAILTSHNAFAVCSDENYSQISHSYDGISVWSNGGAVGVGDNYGDCVKITTYLPRIKDDNSWGGETNNTNGIYFAWVANPHGDMIFGDGLWVTTKGNYSDVVKTNSANSTFGGHSIIIGNGALLESEGLNASIINVAQSPNGGTGYGRVIVGNDSQLIVRGSGTGVRVNLTSSEDKYNLAYIGNNSIITGNGDSINSNDSIGYGVFAGNRDTLTHNNLFNGYAKGTNAVAIINSGAVISTTGQKSHAIYANKGGVIQLYGADITATGTGADAIFAEKKMTADNNNNELGGIVNIAGDLSIVKADDGYAMHTMGDNTKISSSVTNYYWGAEDKLYDGSGAVLNENAKITSDTTGVYRIQGNLFAESGLIDLRMAENASDGSQFIGYTKLGTDLNSLEKGKINLAISGEKSYWKMTNNSELNQLSLTNSARLEVSDNNFTLTGQLINPSGIINLSGTSNQPSRLTVDGNYIGGATQPTENNKSPQGNGTIVVNTVWNEDSNTGNTRLINSYTDSVYIKGTALGYTEVKTKNGIIGDIASDSVNSSDKYSPIVITVDNHTLGANSFYGFANTTGQEQAILVQTDNNNYAWKLFGSQSPPINPVNPINPKVPEAILMPKANLNAGYSILATLHERLSERQTIAWDDCGACQIEHIDGLVWGRIIGNYNKTEGKTRFDYRSKLWGMQFGYDFNINDNKDNNTRSHSSIMVTYAKDNLAFYNSKNIYFDTTSGSYGQNNIKTAHGQSDIYSLALSHAYYDNNGSYLDFVGMLNYIQNKYTTNTASNDKNHAYGVIFSAEAGRPFAITHHGLSQGDWFIEPQAQLIYQYLNYNSYRTTDNIKVDQNNQQGLRGRIGARFAYNQGTEKLKTQSLYFTGNIIHDFLNQKNIDFGTSKVSEKNAKTAAELGIGIQLPLTNTSYIYFDTRYYHSLTNSDGKTKEFSGTLGLKYFW
ncbi:autotransporter outer membrane beta-barrel domain-containing protein [Orbus wheelerorum]|uniref:autotransporter family protein n=1 Tax=Orbus wheelerorum TaxID=3074111 RepID=UPI00370D3D3E